MLTKEQVVEVLKGVEDPEIMVDVWTLELIYDVSVSEENVVRIVMTLTTPMCPYGPMMLDDIKQKLLSAGASDVEIVLDFEKPWEPSEDLRTVLGI